MYETMDVAYYDALREGLKQKGIPPGDVASIVRAVQLTLKYGMLPLSPRPAMQRPAP